MKILFLGYSKNQGLCYHDVDFIRSTDKLITSEIKIILLTLKEEQNPGLHKKLQELHSIPVITVDSEEDLEGLSVFNEVDIVHCQGFGQVRKVLKIKKKRKLNYSIIITMNWFGNDRWYKNIYTNLVTMLYSKELRVMHFLSQSSKNEFLRFNIFYNHTTQSYTFPFGCNKYEFSQIKDIESLEFYNELQANKKNIVYLANFTPGKQHIWLIDTIRDILVQEQAILWLFGEGPMRKNVLEYVQTNNLHPYVKLPGRIDRKYIPTILKKMNLAVCSSNSETEGHTIVEPMFAGVPIVTFDVGIANYLVRDFNTGFIIKDKSEQNSFQHAVSLILKNSDFANKLGQNAQLVVNEWLTWEIAARNTIDMYCTLCNSGNTQ